MYAWIHILLSLINSIYNFFSARIPSATRGSKIDNSSQLVSQHCSTFFVRTLLFRASSTLLKKNKEVNEILTTINKEFTSLLT